MSNQNAESLDVSAKTVEEAIEQGLAQLNLSQDEVHIKILKEGRRGVFGLGAEEAEVRLTRKQEKPAAAGEPPSEAGISPPPEPTTESSAEETTVSEADTPTREPSDLPTAETSVEEIAVRYLSGLLSRMGLDKARIKTRIATDLVEEGEEPPLVLNITGQDLGILIGRRSETLQALQYMLRLMVSKELSSWQPIIVDVESYRVRRRQSLLRMADKMAERATTSGKRVVLEAMPAYERRVIHVALKDHPSVITKSIGSDENRKVTIIPK